MMKEDRNSELQTFVLKVQFPLCMKTNPKGEVSWGLGVVESDVVAESNQKHLWISVTSIGDREGGSLKATRMRCAACPQRAVRATAPCAPSPLTPLPRDANSGPGATTRGQV